MRGGSIIVLSAALGFAAIPVLKTRDVRAGEAEAAAIKTVTFDIFGMT